MSPWSLQLSCADFPDDPQAINPTKISDDSEPTHAFPAPCRFAWREAVHDRIPGLDHPVLDDARAARAMSGRVPAAEAIAPLEEPLAAGLLGLEGADVLDNLRGQSRPIVGGPAVAGVIDGEVVRLRALGGFNRTTWQWLEQRTSSPAADTDATALAGDPFDATQRGACAAALQAPVRTLAFEPVPVDVPQAR